MVIYNPSEATTTIKVITPEVNTNITITAPADVIAGESFIIEGSLTRVDTNAALSGETIVLTYTDKNLNEFSLGTATTGTIEGSVKYSKTVTISTDSGADEYTLKASFEGSTRTGLTLGASNALSNIRSQLGQNIPLVIAATAILGTILMAFGLSK